MVSQFWKIRKGQSLIELLIAMALAAVLIPAFMTGIMTTREGRAQQPQRATANAYLREAQEAVRQVRENGWSTFAVNGTFHPVVASGAWTLVSGNETTSDGFVRSIDIADAKRDGSGNLADSGTVDPSTKKITIAVAWNLPYQSQVTNELYVTRYLDNLVYTETTEAQFNAGVKSGTNVTNTAGGEVILGAGGQGDWCNPNLSISALDLPKSGVANALTAIEGRAFAVTGDNASGVSFANVTISNTNPPVAAITGTFDGYKTNSVFGETNYAYLATDSNSKEIVIINLGNYSEAGYFNAPGNDEGNSIFVAGNVGYMTDEDKLYTFDLSAKTGSRGQLGSVNLVGTGRKVIVSGTYAYVATENTSNQLQIVDVSNPSSMTIVGQAGLAGGTGAVDVFINSSASRAYVTAGKLYIVDISTKTGSRPTVGSYNTNGMTPKGVTGVSGNKIIIVGTGAEEYQVVDVTTESSPSRCGGLNVDAGINGVASVMEQDGDAYSYIITRDAGAEFRMIAGGPGGRYSSSGTFISRAFDPGYSTSYNRISFTGVTPNQTSLSVQTAVSADCINYTFTDSLGFNVGRCFKYKLYLTTTDANATPVFYDLTVNYSP
ncbi:MAG: prepilin-type N-terminal cleavage/methylation domain-containing protein [Candidatus Amesbacteria bacterium]|nr:prepilin-type N-terminal cleavage/methylation domain-containing protein [Candidatus Amesbacteria bacterium]